MASYGETLIRQGLDEGIREEDEQLVFRNRGYAVDVLQCARYGITLKTFAGGRFDRMDLLSDEETALFERLRRWEAVERHQDREGTFSVTADQAPVLVSAIERNIDFNLRNYGGTIYNPDVGIA